MTTTTTAIDRPTATGIARHALAYALALADAHGLPVSSLGCDGLCDSPYRQVRASMHLHRGRGLDQAAELRALADRLGWRTELRSGTNWHLIGAEVPLCGETLRVEIVGSRWPEMV